VRERGVQLPAPERSEQQTIIMEDNSSRHHPLTALILIDMSWRLNAPPIGIRERLGLPRQAGRGDGLLIALKSPSSSSMLFPCSRNLETTEVDAMKQELAQLHGILLDAGKGERRAVKTRTKELKRQLKAAVGVYKANEMSETASMVSSLPSDAAQLEIEKLRAELGELKDALLMLPPGLKQSQMMAQATATEMALPEMGDATVLTLIAERDLLRAKLLEMDLAHQAEVSRLASILELVPMLEEELDKERRRYEASSAETSKLKADLEAAHAKIEELEKACTKKTPAAAGETRSEQHVDQGKDSCSFPAELDTEKQLRSELEQLQNEVQALKNGHQSELEAVKEPQDAYRQEVSRREALYGVSRREVGQSRGGNGSQVPRGQPSAEKCAVSIPFDLVAASTQLSTAQESLHKNLEELLREVAGVATCTLVPPGVS
jgi:hypothetical protein